MRTTFKSATKRGVALLGIATVLFCANGCKDDQNSPTPPTEKDPLEVEKFFDYSTEKKLTFDIRYNSPIKVRFEVFAQDPIKKVSLGKDINGEELFENQKNAEISAIAAGFTDENGAFNGSVTVPASAQELFIYTSNTNVPTLYKAQVTGNTVNARIAGTQTKAATEISRDGLSLIESYTYTPSTNNIVHLYVNEVGTDKWYTNGAPAANKTANFMDDVDPAVLETASLLATSYPNGHFESKKAEFLNKHLIKNDFTVAETGEVRLQVLSTNCAWTSTLAYYVYQEGEITDLSSLEQREKYMIIPLAKAQNGSWDVDGSNYCPLKAPIDPEKQSETFKLINPKDNSYTFEEGTKIGFVLYADSYRMGSENGKNPTINLSKPNYTKAIEGKNVLTIPENPTSDFDYQITTNTNPCQMAITAKVEGLSYCYEVFGFEHDRWGLYPDYDFDDVIFGLSNVIGNDAGVDPAPATFSKRGLLLYEDNWPKKEDYDMNDVVVAYDITHYVNDANELVSSAYKYDIVWAGAQFNNGFKVALPAAVSSIEDLGGQNGYQRLNEISNNVVTLCDATKDWFDLHGPHATAFIPKYNFLVTYEEGTPYEISDNFNPFIIARQTTTMKTPEIHLIDGTPTTYMTGNADLYALFNTENDCSLTAQSDGKTHWYAGVNYLPFAINMVDPGDGSVLSLDFYKKNETVSINLVFSNFTKWANREPGFENIEWWKE